MHLVAVTSAAAHAVLAGGHLPRAALAWHEEYPLTETYDALGMTVRTHEALGWSGTRVPAWWVFQIVLDDPALGEIVVGDIGFHGPPTEGSGVVEVGYDVVPALRSRGIATLACGLILQRAWADGATQVIAETALDHAASQRVLTKAGFRASGPGAYAVSRPFSSTDDADAGPHAATGAVSEVA